MLRPKKKRYFRQRANNLRRKEDDRDFTTSTFPLAVIALNGEYFGLNLEVVREFTDIRKFTPIPCTPRLYCRQHEFAREKL